MVSLRRRNCGGSHWTFVTPEFHRRDLPSLHLQRPRRHPSSWRSLANISATGHHAGEELVARDMRRLQSSAHQFER